MYTILNTSRLIICTFQKILVKQNIWIPPSSSITPFQPCASQESISFLIVFSFRSYYCFSFSHIHEIVACDAFEYVYGSYRSVEDPKYFFSFSVRLLKSPYAITYLQKSFYISMSSPQTYSLFTINMPRFLVWSKQTYWECRTTYISP